MMIAVNLGHQIQNIKMTDTDDARVHTMKLQDMREQLASMGKTLDDAEFAAIILRSLPSSYEPTISAINAAADQVGTPVTSDRVIRLAIDEYDRRIIKNGKPKNSPEEAFAANGQKRDRRDIECHNCHKKGHYKSECWGKGGDIEGQYPPRKDGNNNNNGNSNNNRNNNGGNSNNRNS